MMDRAKASKGGGDQFNKPDIAQYVPDDMKDVVARVTAAGIKIMYSPEMKDELMQAVQSQDPIPKRIADNVTGLMLTLDQKTQGGIPQAAIFPAAVELAGEAGEALGAAGQTVTQEDFNDSLLMLFAMLGKKLGGSDEELMGAAAQSLKDAGGDPTEGAPPEQPGEPADVAGQPDEPDPAMPPGAPPTVPPQPPRM